MKRLGPTASSFHDQFDAGILDFGHAAAELLKLLHDVLDPVGLDVHLFVSRPKQVDAAREKSIRKGYDDPATEMTDLVGGRVITYYADEVDRVVEALKGALDIDVTRTEDKRISLDLSEFGYRSVHIIAKARGGQLVRYPSLTDCWTEIQVRGILEHGWAEIEHEVVYKSGISFPDSIKRRFFALAATLELVDEAFISLRNSERQLAVEYRRAFEAGVDGTARLDAVRLAAFLEAKFPTSPGWRDGVAAKGVPRRLAARLMQALNLAGISTADDLARLIAEPGHGAAVAKFARAEGISEAEVSHSAILLLVLGRLDGTLVAECLPQFWLDPSLRAALVA